MGVDDELSVRLDDRRVTCRIAYGKLQAHPDCVRCLQDLGVEVQGQLDALAVCTCDECRRVGRSPL